MSLTPAWELALLLVTAHLIGDYLLQTDRIAQTKHRWPVLVWHGVIHGITAYLLAGRWGAWDIPLVTMCTHVAIDRVKISVRGAGSTALCLDQLAHGVVVAALVVFSSSAGVWSGWSGWFGSPVARLAVAVSGGVITVQVAGIFIGYWIQPYLKEIEQARGPESTTAPIRGLTNAGRIIGQWERALIFVFVGLGQPAAIGFLIVAKSIFRFGELTDRKNRMEADYLTIGTLMSFGWATASAHLTWWLFVRM